MTPDQILRDFARDDMFPKAAMAAARADREAMAPVFVDLVRRLGEQRVVEMDDADVMALIPVFHLLGEWQDPAAHGPLVHLLRRPAEVLDYLLGDAITETSYRVLAGTFNDDLELLFAAVEDGKADAFARSACMHALVLIAQTRPELRDAIVGFFRSFLTRYPTSPQIVLTGWMDAISGLGLEDMSDQVNALFQDGRIPAAYCNFEHFLEDLRETLDPAIAGADVVTRKASSPTPSMSCRSGTVPPTHSSPNRSAKRSATSFASRRGLRASRPRSQRSDETNPVPAAAARSTRNAVFTDPFCEIALGQG